MSSDSESFSSCSSSSVAFDNLETDESSESEEAGVVVAGIRAYKDEPLAPRGHLEQSPRCEAEEEADQDGLTPSVLEARKEKRVVVSEWCSCGYCKDEKLEGALEFRCCKEIINASGKLIDDEAMTGITEHKDYAALVNKTVLLEIARFFKDRNGRGYRRRAGVSENEFLRSLAYRFLVKWLCEYMGWDNVRPLPACVYHNVRVKYKSYQQKGYATLQERSGDQEHD